MELILASLNSEIIALSSASPIDGIACNILYSDSVTAALEAAESHPATIVVIDLDTIPITPEQQAKIDPARLITLGTQPLANPPALHHLPIDTQGNYWPLLLMIAQQSYVAAPPPTPPPILTREMAWAMTESASAGMVVVDDRGKIRDLSQRLQQNLHNPYEEIINQSITAALGDCQPDNLENFIRESTPGTVGQFEFVDDRQNPPIIWLLLGHTVVSNNTQYLAGILRNISQRQQSETAMRNTLAENQAVINAQPDGICVLNHESVIIACNLALTELTGYSETELIGQHAGILLDSEDGDAGRPALFDGFEHQENFELRQIRHANGQLINVEAYQTAVGSGKKRRYYSTFRDLRERQATQRQLETSEARYRTIFGAIPDSIAITTQAGDYLEVNRAYCELSGFSREALLDKNVTMVAENQEQLKQFYETVINDERAYVHTEATRRDGRPVTMDTFGALVPASEPDALPNVIIIHRDLSVQIAAEHNRKQLSDKLDRLVAAAPLAVFEIDLHKNIVSWNPAAEMMFGYTASEACHHRLTDITPTSRHTKLNRVWNEMVADPTPFFYLGQGINRAGETLELEWYITPITAEDNEIVTIITLAHDITERRQLEQQVRQVQKMEAIGQLAGGIAHDFNNILAGILGYSELAAEAAAGLEDTALADYISAIHQAGNRGRDLIRQLLNYSRTQPINLQVFDPEPVINEVLDMLSVTLPATVVIQRSAEPDLPKIEADPTQLHQVLMNICINARDALPGAHGELQVNATRRQIDKQLCDSCHQPFSGQYLCISVEDNGSGIKSSVLRKIFDPFFTTKEVGKGTGMGLPAADGIIHSIAGHLQLHSVVGTGSRFDVYLPVSMAEAKPRSPEAEKPPVGTTDHHHLLLVDDEPSIIVLLQELFSQQGYRVTSCASATEALKLFDADETQFDLVITDHTMPTMTGTELATEILQRAPDIPVILCTGYMLNNEPDAWLPANIRERLLKPVPTGELFAAVHRLLANPTPVIQAPPPAG